jgi:hypothetical protein
MKKKKKKEETKNFSVLHITKGKGFYGEIFRPVYLLLLFFLWVNGLG